MWRWIWNFEYTVLLAKLKHIKSIAPNPKKWNRLFLYNVRVEAGVYGGETSNM